MQQTNQAHSDDWRVRLFGEYIQRNVRVVSNKDKDKEQPANDDYTSGSSSDIESPNTGTQLVPTREAFDQDKYDYICAFLGADYCKFCKAFAPTVNTSAANLETNKRCKVIFVSNDRTQEAFQASCIKNAGIDVMPYDLAKTQAMRDLFGLKTIPAFMVLRNNDLGAAVPPVVTNARNALAADPEAVHFPWKKPDVPEKISMMDRLFIRGKYGRWWELGHHANPEHPDQVYMDEHAVRIRAGFLNTISW